jgi:hypothetical protein
MHKIFEIIPSARLRFAVVGVNEKASVCGCPEPLGCGCSKRSMLLAEPLLNCRGPPGAPLLELGELWQRAQGSVDPADRRTLAAVRGDPDPPGNHGHCVLSEKFVAGLMLGVSASELL